MLESIDLDKITADLAARRNALSQFSAPIDKADMPRATVRAQIREHIKSLPPDKARAFLRAADETTAAAVLEGPAFLSGMSAEAHADFRESRLRALHPEKTRQPRRRERGGASRGPHARRRATIDAHTHRAIFAADRN